MPDLSAINDFNETLSGLGSESEFLVRHGRSSEPPREPEPQDEAESSPSTDEFLADLGLGDEPDTAADEADDLGDDFSDDFADEFSDAFPDDVGALDDSEIAEPVPDDFDEPTEAPLDPAPAPETPEDIAADEFSGDFSDDLTDDLGDDFSDDFSDEFSDAFPDDGGALDDTDSGLDDEPLPDDAAPEDEQPAPGQIADDPLGELDDDLAGAMEFDADLGEFADDDIAEPTEASPAEDADLDDLSELSFDDESLAGGGELAAEDDLGDVDDLGDLGDFGDDALSDDLPGIGDEGLDSIDEFSMGDFGAEFGVLEEAETPTAPEAQPEESATPAAAVSEEDFSLSDEEFRRLRSTLAALPLNIKLAVEECLGSEQYSLQQTQPLIERLVNGDAAQSIAGVTGRILGRKLQVPRGYRRRTGVEFEQEQQSFAYIFRERILPVLQVALAASLAVAVLTFAGIRFVYRPIRANVLYQRGYEAVQQQRISDGRQLFQEATETWRVRRWFFTYADEFMRQRRFGLAETTYEELIGLTSPLEQTFERRGGRDVPVTEIMTRDDPEGVLALGNLLVGRLARYERAVEVYNLYLNTHDRDSVPVLLARGDAHLAWGEVEPSQYENARQRYAELAAMIGQTNEIIFRMLRYAMRTDRHDDVGAMADYLLQDGVPPETDAMAELAGYYLRNDIPGGRQLSPAFEALGRNLDVLEDAAPISAEEARREGLAYPETYYQFARYYSELNDLPDLRVALSNAEQWYRAWEPLDRNQTRQFLDLLRRKAGLRVRDGQLLQAEEAFLEAIDRLQRAEATGLLEPGMTEGLLFRDYANLLYYQSREFAAAGEFLDRAEELGIPDLLLDFQQGYIDYLEGRYRDALGEFVEAAGPFSSNRNLLFATATAMYRESSPNAAAAYYGELLDDVRQDFRLPEVPSEARSDQERAVTELLIKAANNLGVISYERFLQTLDITQYNRAIDLLQQSSEAAQNYRRDPNTLEVLEPTNLADLNLREVLRSEADATGGDFQLQIYAQIPRDFTEAQF